MKKKIAAGFKHEERKVLLNFLASKELYALQETLGNEEYFINLLIHGNSRPLATLKNNILIANLKNHTQPSTQDELWQILSNLFARGVKPVCTINRFESLYNYVLKQWPEELK